MKLEIPWCKTAIEERLIGYHGTRLWNALPLELRMEDLGHFNKEPSKNYVTARGGEGSTILLHIVTYIWGGRGGIL